MKLAELREVREKASPNWRAGVRYPESLTIGERHLFHTRLLTPEDAQLAALAPDLARLVDELGEALTAYRAIFVAWEGRKSITLNEEALRQWKSIADAALAKLEELGER